MNGHEVTFHPAFLEAVKAAAEIDEERVKLQCVLEHDTFERVRVIVEAQEPRKRAAYYGTIYEAACAGEDFSRVESLRDIADIYARFAVRRAFGE